MVKKNRIFNNKYIILKDPFFISAFFLCILIYTGKIMLPDNERLISNAKISEICKISGKISSSPQKLSKSNNYSCFIKNAILTLQNGSLFYSKGKIKITFDSKYAECLRPEKIFSENEIDYFLCDIGTSIEINGHFNKEGNVFYGEKVEKGTFYKNTIIEKLYYFRAVLRLKFIRILTYWADAGGLFLALLSGIREYLEDNSREAFKNAGLSHILALSGMHLSLFRGITQKILLNKKNIFTTSIEFFAISFFVWFAGISPSLLRAYICSLITIFISLTKKKRIEMISVLSICFEIHTIIKPTDLFELAFILSYGALFGILLLGNFFTFLSVVNIPCSIASSFGASLGAQGATTPISIKMTGSFSPIGIISSVIITPLINIFIYSGIIIFILCFIFPFLCIPGAKFMQILYNVIEKSVKYFSVFPIISFLQE